MGTEPLHIRVYRLMGEAGVVRAALDAGEAVAAADKEVIVRWSRFCRRAQAPYAALLMARDLKDKELGEKACEGIRAALDEVGAA